MPVPPFMVTPFSTLGPTEATVPAMRRSHRKRQEFHDRVRPWLTRLLGVAGRQADSPQTAEEWVQETLLRAWRDFDQLRERQAIHAWLQRILDRVISEDLRRNLRRAELAPVLDTDDIFLQALPGGGPDPLEAALENQTGEKILQAISALPEAFRKAILLRDVEGLSYREIAEILELPTGTVMSRLSRGRRLLADRLVRMGVRDTETAGSDKRGRV